MSEVIRHGGLPLRAPAWSTARDPSAGLAMALMSTRGGGVSHGPFGSLNLRRPTGAADQDDAADAVAENRRRFAAALGAVPLWLSQVHGVRVVRAEAAMVQAQRDDAGWRTPQADAAITTEPGVACTVMVADCLPVLFASQDRRVVGAAHAGWRGLAGGVLEATIGAMCDAAGVAPVDLVAWFGPCIGPGSFEVGADVLAGFDCDAAPDGRPHGADAAHFRFTPRPDGSPRWHADLPALAISRLHRAGVGAVDGVRCDTVTAADCFSYRREPVSGRMAAGIALSSR